MASCSQPATQAKLSCTTPPVARVAMASCRAWISSTSRDSPGRRGSNGRSNVLEAAHVTSYRFDIQPTPPSKLVEPGTVIVEVANKLRSTWSVSQTIRRACRSKQSCELRRCRTPRSTSAAAPATPSGSALRRCASPRARAACSQSATTPNVSQPQPGSLGPLLGPGWITCSASTNRWVWVRWCRLRSDSQVASSWHASADVMPRSRHACKAEASTSACVAAPRGKTMASSRLLLAGHMHVPAATSALGCASKKGGTRACRDGRDGTSKSGDRPVRAVPTAGPSCPTRIRTTRSVDDGGASVRCAAKTKLLTPAPKIRVTETFILNPSGVHSPSKPCRAKTSALLYASS
eukprot:scaffold99745_cov66-Phaeocystis_antarctica.AAC.5